MVLPHKVTGKQLITATGKQHVRKAESRLKAKGRNRTTMLSRYKVQVK